MGCMPDGKRLFRELLTGWNKPNPLDLVIRTKASLFDPKVTL
jgi:hypothetical protein